jgi:transcription elongation GreA/GreB family factor
MWTEEMRISNRLSGSGYLAAIECDGATYHSAVSVRDRDRIRQEILESLGWKGRIWRIWSTDWFRNPVDEGNKLLDFLHTIEEASSEEIEKVAPHQDCSKNETDTVVNLTEADLLENEVALNNLDDEDEEYEISIGDIVSYKILEAPDQGPMMLQIGLTNDLSQGVVGHHTPLGQALLGATVGENVVLRVPGQPSKTYEIQSIKRDL